MEAESPPKTGGGEIPQKDGEVGSQSEESGEVMKGLLEEANRMLKNISDNKSEKGEEGDDREGKLRRLQRQLDDLKALRVFRIASIGESGGHDTCASRKKARRKTQPVAGSSSTSGMWQGNTSSNDCWRN